MSQPTSRGLPDLVEHQLRRWEVEPRATVPQPRAPCVAVSGQMGAGADALALKVAEWLDYGCFHGELLDAIGADEGVQRRLVSDLDEGALAAFECKAADLERRAGPDAPDVRAVARVLAVFAERGMAVLVGRGATALLPPERALRVLIVAPRALRVERLAKERDVPGAEAEALLASGESQRAGLLRGQLSVEPDDPERHDLVVNTGHLSPEAGARIVIEALRRRHRQ